MSNKLKNPIIPGYYPDPTICRVGDDYYIACSSFEMCPGLPVFHSRDLAHWEQICNAISQENGFHMEKNCGVGGLMAPTLRYRDGIFYIINTNFSDKGNYIITAENPAGPWSEPHWLTDVPGIDASLFFDHDGKAYIMGTGDVWENEGGRKERGIWLAEYDVEQFQMIGEPKTIFNSALRVGSSPEAPHLYHIGEYYHLIIAEGGTEHYHAVMHARSKELFGFYEGNPANPVLTHRHMGYECPITNVGHADLVELPDGSWYAVMLASRLIDKKAKNLGRETFICPVKWERDWPIFSPETGKVEWEYDAPQCLPWTPIEDTSCNLETFDSEKLENHWVTWGSCYEDIYEIRDSKLFLKCIKQSLVEELRPMAFDEELNYHHYASFLGQRQTQVNEVVSCEMNFMPKENECAGLVVMQAMNHQFIVERAIEDGRQVLRAVSYTAEYELPPYFPGFSSKTNRNVLISVPYETANVVLQIEMQGENFIVCYGQQKDELKELCTFDGNIINPEKVGCMTGTLLGMFASANGNESDNYAAFEWFKLSESEKA